ncbi:MAG: hypothetical protein IKO93_01500, partial [Lentisphaeria bacterium]|nr:hypothetical protein [Lentisphaeria bacterium]
MAEKNYDFRARHWEYHKPGRRDPRRKAGKNELVITSEWEIGFDADEKSIAAIAARDFRDYLETSMGISLRITREKGPKVIWIEVSPKVKKGFVIEVKSDRVTVSAAEDKMTFRGTIHLEDLMNLEEAPVLQLGRLVRKPLYRIRSVHSGSGIDNYPDSELIAMLHAGYDEIELFMVDF